MYILKWHGYHVVRGNKDGMAPKVPDPSCRAPPGAIFVFLILVFFVPTFHHYAVPAVRHCPYDSLFSLSQHYNVLIPGRKCLIGVNNTPAYPGLSWAEVAWVHRCIRCCSVFCFVFSAHSQLSNLHAMLRLMTNFEILQTSPYQEDKQSLFIKMKCQWKVIFWE